MNDPIAHLHPWTLRFRDPAVEAAYVRDTARGRRAELQVAAALLIALYALFVLSDLLLFPAQVVPLAAIRFGFAVPALCVGASFLFVERLRPYTERQLDLLLFALACVACGGLVAMGAVIVDTADLSQLIAAALGMLVMTTFLYGFLKIRVHLTLLLGLTASFASLALLGRRPDVPDTLWATLTLFAVGVNAGGAWMARALELLSRRAFATRRALAAAQDRADALLQNALPATVVARLRDDDHAVSREREALADRHDAVTVVLADVVGFTPLSERLPPEALARHLDRLFRACDELAARHGVEKIKTLGDAWLGAAGVPTPCDDHAARAAAFAGALLRAVADEPNPDFPVALRVGVHTGPVVAGVIGRTRFAYDIWGDGVDGARATEAAGAPGRVRLSATTCALLDPARVARDGSADGAGWWVALPADHPEVADPGDAR